MPGPFGWQHLRRILKWLTDDGKPYFAIWADTRSSKPWRPPFGKVGGSSDLNAFGALYHKVFGLTWRKEASCDRYWLCIRKDLIAESVFAG